MARIIGQSGAWQTIVDDLARRGQTISSPGELPSLLNKLENNKPQAIEDDRERMTLLVKEKESLIIVMSTQRGFFRRLVNWFKTRKLKREIRKLHYEHSLYLVYLDQTIERVRALIHSAELSGAEAELSVIEYLSKLPDHVVVFNDVRLRATRHIYFDGVTLQSAQIDHVVLTRAGIFIIETKRWSRNFVESGDYHNPFDQVSRANYLCYDLLRQRFGKIHVRSIIASEGTLPDPPKQTYIKVLRPKALADYIGYFRDVELPEEQFKELFEFFEKRVGFLESIASIFNSHTSLQD